MTDETKEIIPVSFDYKVIVGVTLALIGIAIAYYFARKYIPSVVPTTLHVVEQEAESEDAGA